MNIQPGMGLGFTASKEIADGLGTPYTVVVIVVGGGGFEPNPSLGLNRRIIRDDGEVFEIIIIAIQSGLIK